MAGRGPFRSDSEGQQHGKLTLAVRLVFFRHSAEYSATGRDATGAFDGGANDPPNLGAGVMPGRAT